MNRTLLFALGCAVVACTTAPDDPFDPDKGDGESTSDSGEGSMSDDGTHDSDPDDGADQTGEDGTTTDGGGESGDSGTDTGTDEPPADHKWLYNDGWTAGSGLNWQVWAGPGDCWASVYQVEAQDRPFAPVRVRVAIGGGNTTETFALSLQEVDNEGQPTQVIAEANVNVQGESDWTDIELNGLGLDDTLDLGEFAVVMCHSDHRGAPSVATDDDGDVAGRLNWVYQVASGEWVQAATFGSIDGDFMLRVLVDTQP